MSKITETDKAMANVAPIEEQLSIDGTSTTEVNALIAEADAACKAVEDALEQFVKRQFDILEAMISIMADDVISWQEQVNDAYGVGGGEVYDHDWYIGEVRKLAIHAVDNNEGV